MPFKNEKKRVFCFFFFRESHDFAFARGTVVLSRESRACLFRKGKNHAPGSVFSSVIFHEKKFVKTYQHGSSFEDLNSRNPTAKAVQDLDARFKR